MLTGSLSPLAPAVILLLGAFILSVVVPRLPLRWQQHPGVRSYSVLTLIGLAGITLLFIRIANDNEPVAQVISSWNFGMAQPVISLTLQIDTFNLAFFIIVLLVLLLVALLRFEHISVSGQAEDRVRTAGWLFLGAGTCLLLSAADSLALAYVGVAFDTVAVIFGLRLDPRYRAIGAARIFLGVLTTAAILMAGLAAPAGLFLLGLALWLRLGLMPLLEAATLAGWPPNDRLVYQGLTLTGGIYLALRVMNEPLPELVRWLIVAIMLLAGLLSWLTSSDESEAGAPSQFRSKILGWLVLAEALLLLLAGPLPSGVLVAFATGLILSWLILSITPLPGLPEKPEQAWFWPYLPAALATLTLIGVPFSLGWLAKVSIYASLLTTSNLVLLLLALAAEILVLSGLIRYWLTMVMRGYARDSRWLHVGVLAITPWLVPGVAPFILFYLTGLNLSISSTPPSGAAIVILVAILIVALIIGYRRQMMIAQFDLPAGWLERQAYLLGLFGLGQRLFDGVSRSLLRWRVITEGQHYLGWAIFSALIGSLIILLSSASR